MSDRWFHCVSPRCPWRYLHPKTKSTTKYKRQQDGTLHSSAWIKTFPARASEIGLTVSRSEDAAPCAHGRRNETFFIGRGLYERICNQSIRLWYPFLQFQYFNNSITRNSRTRGLFACANSRPCKCTTIYDVFAVSTVRHRMSLLWVIWRSWEVRS